MRSTGASDNVGEQSAVAVLLHLKAVVWRPAGRWSFRDCVFNGDVGDEPSYR